MRHRVLAASFVVLSSLALAPLAHAGGPGGAAPHAIPVPVRRVPVPRPAPTPPRDNPPGSPFWSATVDNGVAGPISVDMIKPTGLTLQPGASFAGFAASPSGNYLNEGGVELWFTPEKPDAHYTITCAVDRTPSVEVTMVAMYANATSGTVRDGTAESHTPLFGPRTITPAPDGSFHIPYYAVQPMADSVQIYLTSKTDWRWKGCTAVHA